MLSARSKRTKTGSFDAVIAALAASSAAFGQSTSPSVDKLEVAQIEGWVALPLGTLASLRSRLG